MRETASDGDLVEAELRVGMLDVASAKLISADHHTIEFPTSLLPENVVAGSIVKSQCSRAASAEYEDAQKFAKVQQEILDTFATNLPKAPVLRARNVTQTSVVSEWDQIDIANADLSSMASYKGDQRLGSIPSPLHRSVTKVSNLEIDQPYNFQLVSSTSAGDFESNKSHVQTHKMTDSSGLVVCLGSLDGSKSSKDDIEQILKCLGAKPAQETVKLETTQFVCTVESGPQYQRALEFNIPVVRPEWSKACESERRLISVRSYYLTADNAYSQSSSVQPQESNSQSTEQQTETSSRNASPESHASSQPEQHETHDTEVQRETSAHEIENALETQQSEPASVQENSVEETRDADEPYTSEEHGINEPTVQVQEPSIVPDGALPEFARENFPRSDSQGDLSAAIEDVASSHDSSFHGSVQVSDGAYEDLNETEHEVADDSNPSSKHVTHSATDSVNELPESEQQRQDQEDRQTKQEQEQHQQDQQDLEKKLMVDPEARLNPSEEHEVVVEQSGNPEPQSAAVAYQSEDGKETPVESDEKEKESTEVPNESNIEQQEPETKQTQEIADKKDVDENTGSEAVDEPKDEKSNADAADAADAESNVEASDSDDEGENHTDEPASNESAETENPETSQAQQAGSSSTGHSSSNKSKKKKNKKGRR